MLLRPIIKRKEKLGRRFWVRKIFMERKQKGKYHLLVKDLALCDHEMFFSQFMMNPTKLLLYIAPLIMKASEKREPIGPSERLCVTLRYLVPGDAQSTISLSYRISKTSLSRIIKETTDALWKVLSERGFIKASEEEWVEIADQFEKKWNFGNCIGAIDGKHVLMQAPPRSVTYFFVYKKTRSIVLMAVVNSNYQFAMVGISDAGIQSDGGVFAASNIGQALDEGLLNIPRPRRLYGNTKLVVHVVLIFFA